MHQPLEWTIRDLELFPEPLDEGDVLESPLLPGLQLHARDVFEGLIEAE